MPVGADCGVRIAPCLNPHDHGLPEPRRYWKEMRGECVCWIMAGFCCAADRHRT